MFRYGIKFDRGGGVRDNQGSRTLQMTGASAGAFRR